MVVMFLEIIIIIRVMSRSSDNMDRVKANHDKIRSFFRQRYSEHLIKIKPASDLEYHWIVNFDSVNPANYLQSIIHFIFFCKLNSEYSKILFRFCVLDVYLFNGGYLFAL